MGYQCVSPCCTLNLLFWVHTPFSDTPISEYNYWPPLCTVLVSCNAHCHIRLSRMGFPHGETKLKTALPKTFTAAHGTRSLREDQAKQQCLKPLLKIPLSGAAPSSLSSFSSNTTTIQQPYLRSIGPDLWVGSSELGNHWAISPQELWQTRRPRWPSSYCEQCLMFGIFVNMCK